MKIKQRVSATPPVSLNVRDNQSAKTRVASINCIMTNLWKKNDYVHMDMDIGCEKFY